MAFIKKLYDNFEEICCAFFLFVMIMCLVFQVVMRIFTGSSFAWTEELSRFAFIYAVFVATALATKKGTHVRITAQLSFFGCNGRLAFRIFSDILWIIFNLFMVYISWETIQGGLEYPEISPTLGVIKAHVEMIIPFCFLLVTWRILEVYYKHLKAGTLAELSVYEEECR